MAEVDPEMMIMTLYEVYEADGNLLLVTSQRGMAQEVADGARGDEIHERKWVTCEMVTETWQPYPKKGLNG